MTLDFGVAEIKLGFEAFSKLLNLATGWRTSKKNKDLQSIAFQELLKGDAADFVKIKAIIKELREEGDISIVTERLNHLYSKAKRQKASVEATVKTGKGLMKVAHHAVKQTGAKAKKAIKLTTVKAKKTRSEAKTKGKANKSISKGAEV